MKPDWLRAARTGAVLTLSIALTGCMTSQRNQMYFAAADLNKEEPNLKFYRLTLKTHAVNSKAHLTTGFYSANAVRELMGEVKVPKDPVWTTATDAATKPADGGTTGNAGGGTTGNAGGGTTGNAGGGTTGNAGGGTTGNAGGGTTGNAGGGTTGNAGGGTTGNAGGGNKPAPTGDDAKPANTPAASPAAPPDGVPGAKNFVYDPNEGRWKQLGEDQLFTIVYGTNADEIANQIKAFYTSQTTGDMIGKLLVSNLIGEDFMKAQGAAGEIEGSNANLQKTGAALKATADGLADDASEATAKAAVNESIQAVLSAVMTEQSNR